MGTYVVTAGPLADEGKNLRDYKKKGTEKWKKSEVVGFFLSKSQRFGGSDGTAYI